MSTNLFLLSTPSQLINTVEAKLHFNITNESSVVIFNAYSTNLLPIKSILDRSEWREVYFIDDDFESQKRHEENLKGGINFISSIKRVRENFKKLQALVKQFLVVENLFVGYYLGLENIHFINSIHYKRLILLDDGIATLEINRRRLKRTSFFNTWNIEFFGRTLFKYFILGYKLSHPKSATFFTAYNITPSANDFIIKNTYTAIKRLSLNKIRGEKIYFLGQPLSEEMPKILSEEVYFKYFEYVVHRFGAHNLVYIPHRDEDKLKLERLGKRFGVVIEFINVPFELFLLKQSELPNFIVGIITSAIPNCKEMFGDSFEIIALRINNQDIINKSMVTTVEDTYSYFETLVGSKFKIVSIN